jgi:hypothetical protein
MRAHQEYQFWLKQPKSEDRSGKLTKIREAYDVSQTGAERIVKDMGKHSNKRNQKIQNTSKRFN